LMRTKNDCNQIYDLRYTIYAWCELQGGS